MFRVEKVLVVVLIAVLAGVLMYECLTPTGFLYPYREEEAPEHRRRLPFGLFDTASKVADSNSEWATRDAHQSKVFYNGEYFFVFFWDGVDAPQLPYASSPDGVTWSKKTVYDGIYGLGATGLALAGGVDIVLKSDVKCYISFTQGLGDFAGQAPIHFIGSISGSTISRTRLYGAFDVGNEIIRSNLNLRPDGKLFTFSHGEGNYIKSMFVPDPPAPVTFSDYGSPAWTSNSGGVRLLNYKTSSPYDMIGLIKQGTDNVLYYTFLRGDNPPAPDLPWTSMNVTLREGFSTFCATSEAIKEGDPERVHLVYIKSSGELCYRRFENDVWSGETVLVEKGASCPVIACGENGRLYVFYVFNGVIKLLKFDGEKWLKKQVQDAFPFHTYNNPAYLSTNQVAQHGKICLVWTERNLVHGEKPYAVWFGYIEDG